MILIRSFQIVTIAQQGADCFPKTVFVGLLCSVIQKRVRHQARIPSIFHILQKYEKSVQFQKLCFVLRTRLLYNSNINIIVYTKWNHVTSNMARNHRSCNSLETTRQFIKKQVTHTNTQSCVVDTCCNCLSNLPNKVTIQTTETRIDARSLTEKQKGYIAYTDYKSATIIRNFF